MWKHCLCPRTNQTCSVSDSSDSSDSSSSSESESSDSEPAPKKKTLVKTKAKAKAVQRVCQYLAEPPVFNPILELYSNSLTCHHHSVVFRPIVHTVLSDEVAQQESLYNTTTDHNSSHHLGHPHQKRIRPSLLVDHKLRNQRPKMHSPHSTCAR